MSIIKVNEIQNVAGTQNKGVLQVVSATKTDAFSTTSASAVDLTGMTVTLTPRSTDSKVFITGNVEMSCDSSGTTTFINLVRAISGGATSNLAINTDAGNTNATIANNTHSNYNMTNNGFDFLDSPNTTSAITYHLEAFCNGSNNIRINRRGDSTIQGGVSTITAMEIQG